MPVLVDPSRERGVLSFRAFGVPVQVQPSFFLIALVFGAASNDAVLVAAWVAIVFVSVLLHELGHAAAYRVFGKSPRIVLYGMGGLTYGESVTPLRTAVVSLAGPFTGFAVGALVWLVAYKTDALAKASPLAFTVVRDILWVNVGWGIVNLLPILPLDGAQAVGALVEARTGRSALASMRIVSVVVGGAAAFYALSRGMVWSAFIAGGLALQNGLAARRAARAPSEGENASAKAADATVASDSWETGVALFTEGRFDEALPHVAAAAEKAPGPTTEGLLVRTLVELGRLDEAVTRAGPPTTTSNASVVRIDDGADARLSAALFHAGRFALAFGRDEARFARTGASDAAYNVACSLARTARLDDAIAWLRRAAEAGASDADGLLADDDLASLRGRADFDEVAARFRANAVARSETTASA